VKLIFFDQRELREGAVVGLLALDLAAGRVLVFSSGRSAAAGYWPQGHYNLVTHTHGF
jgi:hypothetical protein